MHRIRRVIRRVVLERTGQSVIAHVGYKRIRPGKRYVQNIIHLNAAGHVTSKHKRIIISV